MKINYKKETIFQIIKIIKFDLDFLDNFLNENIFKIEKELMNLLKIFF